MEFVTCKDIEAPQDHAFAALSAFAVFERQALRQGIDITRTSGDGQVGAGATWQVKFSYRNKPYSIDARVDRFDPPSGYRILGKGNGIAVVTTVDLMPLSRSATRLTFTLVAQPQTLATRILMQSLRLVRGQVQQKLDARIARLARGVEDRWRAIG